MLREYSWKRERERVRENERKREKKRTLSIVNELRKEERKKTPHFRLPFELAMIRYTNMSERTCAIFVGKSYYCYHKNYIQGVPNQMCFSVYFTDSSTNLESIIENFTRRYTVHNFLNFLCLTLSRKLYKK